MPVFVTILLYICQQAWNIDPAIARRNTRRIKLASDVSPQKPFAFGNFMREVFITGELPLRKAYARMFVDSIIASREKAVIKIRKIVLCKTVEATEGATMPISIQEWRTRQDKTINMYVIEITP